MWVIVFTREYNADLNPGCRPVSEVVLNPQSSVNLDFAFLDVLDGQDGELRTTLERCRNCSVIGYFGRRQDPVSVEQSLEKQFGVSENCGIPCFLWFPAKRQTMLRQFERLEKEVQERHWQTEEEWNRCGVQRRRDRGWFKNFSQLHSVWGTRAVVSPPVLLEIGAPSTPTSTGSIASTPDVNGSNIPANTPATEEPCTDEYRQTETEDSELTALYHLLMVNLQERNENWLKWRKQKKK